MGHRSASRSLIRWSANEDAAYLTYAHAYFRRPGRCFYGIFAAPRKSELTGICKDATYPQKKNPGTKDKQGARHA
jgi:hypothetical protein